MWETQHNIVDYERNKTLILHETLKIRSHHREEFCVFSEFTRSYQKVGCARNRLHFSHSSTEAQFLSMQVYAWMGFQLSIFGIQ